MQIRQLAKLEGYRLEKKDDDSYRLINARFNVAVYLLDGVSLEKIVEFLERRTSQGKRARPSPSLRLSFAAVSPSAHGDCIAECPRLKVQ